MTRPTDLADVVACAFAAALPTVVLHSRNLREAGLRSVGERGRGVGNITALDAARLLIAVAGTSSPKDGVATVRRHSRLLAAEGVWSLPFLPVPELKALGGDHTLADAIAALIEAGMSGSLEQAAGGAIDDDGPPALQIDISLWEPEPWSTVTISAMSYTAEGEPIVDGIETRTYRRPIPGGGNLGIAGGLDVEMRGDLRHRHSFSLRTIAAVARLLRG